MTWIDWAIVGLALLGMVLGVRRGSLATAVLVVVLVASFAVAAETYPLLSNRVALPGSPGWTAFAAYLLIFVVVLVAIGALAALALGRPRHLVAGPTLLAAVLGLVYGAGFAAVILVGLLASPAADQIREDVAASVVAPYVAEGARAVIAAIASIIPGFPPLGPGGGHF